MRKTKLKKEEKTLLINSLLVKKRENVTTRLIKISEKVEEVLLPFIPEEVKNFDRNYPEHIQRLCFYLQEEREDQLAVFGRTSKFLVLSIPEIIPELSELGISVSGFILKKSPDDYASLLSDLRTLLKQEKRLTELKMELERLFIPLTSRKQLAELYPEAHAELEKLDKKDVKDNVSKRRASDNEVTDYYASRKADFKTLIGELNNEE